MYLSDQYLVYANGVDGSCYIEPNRCSVTDSSSYGSPSAGWIYNSDSFKQQSNIHWIWFLSPVSDSTYVVFSVNESGLVHSSHYHSNKLGGVRPVLYLSSNVKITDGTGQQNNPYKLGL